MVASTWERLIEGLDPDDLAKLAAFRRFCRDLDDVEERVTSSQIAFARRRIFASAYVKSHYLEVGVELRREVSTPKPRTAFRTSKSVVMHRYSLRELEQFDDGIRDLIREAWETVGPGTRG